MEEYSTTLSPEEKIRKSLGFLSEQHGDFQEKEASQIIQRVLTFLDRIEASPREISDMPIMTVENGPLAKPLSLQMVEIYNAVMEALGPHNPIKKEDKVIYQTNLPGTTISVENMIHQTRPGISGELIKLNYQKTA